MPRRKQNGTGVASDIKNFIVNNRLISRGLGLVPHPAGQVASAIASQLGLGRKRRRRRVATRSVLVPSVRRVRAPRRRAIMTGRGIFSDLGGGLGSALGGLGGGLGSAFHGLFGGSRQAIHM